MAATFRGPTVRRRVVRNCVSMVRQDAGAVNAAAIYAGHRYARELDSPESDRAQVLRDRVFDETP